jgi:hypothetical protein
MSTAFSKDITEIVANASNDFTLSGLGGISTIGITGLRLHVSGGQPTGDNNVTIASFDNATLPEARLIVTY